MHNAPNEKAIFFISLSSQTERSFCSDLSGYGRLKNSARGPARQCTVCYWRRPEEVQESTGGATERRPGPVIRLTYFAASVLRTSVRKRVISWMACCGLSRLFFDHGDQPGSDDHAVGAGVRDGPGMFGLADAEADADGNVRQALELPDQAIGGTGKASRLPVTPSSETV